jgi:enamine deaminase RidA (YjgF/YER057c/UK114 family)
MPTPEDRLAALGLTLPEPVKPVANYVPFVRSGDLIHIAGQVSTDPSGAHLRAQPDRPDARGDRGRPLAGAAHREA